ncbi:hypothetical protein FHW68_001608 [Pseudomonas sp. Tn43]|nr:hypothetical protein [Pseudomonas sp. Tn43]
MADGDARNVAPSWRHSCTTWILTGLD